MKVVLSFAKSFSLAQCCTKVWSCVFGGKLECPGESILVCLGDYTNQAHIRPGWESNLGRLGENRVHYPLR